MITASMIIKLAIFDIIVGFTFNVIVAAYDVHKWNKEIKERKKKITIDECGDVVSINYYSKRDGVYKGVIMTKDKFDIEKNNFNPEDELNNIIRLYYQNESK